MAEVYTNNAITTLNGAINNAVTSVVVTDGSVFPSTGDFRIKVDNEIMLVTARSTNTLTVIRGQESTAAASHSNGATVSHILTALGLKNLTLSPTRVGPTDHAISVRGPNDTFDRFTVTVSGEMRMGLGNAAQTLFIHQANTTSLLVPNLRIRAHSNDNSALTIYPASGFSASIAAYRVDEPQPRFLITTGAQMTSKPTLWFGDGTNSADVNLYRESSNILKTDDHFSMGTGSSFKIGSTSFPGSPSTNDIFYRTDLFSFFIYNGSAWVAIGLGPIRRVYGTSGSPHTWTKPAGLHHVEVEVVGGGGAGGGSQAAASGGNSKGSGGGGGGYSRKVILANDLGSTETVTVGTGGTGSSAANGGAGNASSFGSHCTANGGAGGIYAASSTATFFGSRGGDGASAGTGDIAVKGAVGGNSTGGANLCVSGGGAPGPWGGGGLASGSGASNSGGAGAAAGSTDYGAGGGGSYATSTHATAYAGGNGGPGIVIVTEYYGP